MDDGLLLFTVSEVDTYYIMCVVKGVCKRHCWVLYGPFVKSSTDYVSSWVVHSS